MTGVFPMVDESTKASIGTDSTQADKSATSTPTGNGQDLNKLSTTDRIGQTDVPDKVLKNPPRRGETDTNGLKIENIFSSTRHFVIYEADNQIRYILPDDYEVAKTLRQKIAELGGLRASIEDLRAEPSLSMSEKTRAGREIAWALAEAFEDESSPPSDKPKEILTRVDARLRSLVKSHYRKKYVFANLVAFTAIEIVLILMAIGFGHWWTVPESAVLHRYAMYGACGALGAFLSVITGIRSIDVDIDLKKWEHVFAGATRILIGVVGALVVGLALDSKFIDPTLGSATEETAKTIGGSLERRLALYLMFAFIGGFSESLVPNLLRRGEQAAGTSEGQTTPSNEPIVRTMKP
jgi:hypothetical protein